MSLPEKMYDDLKRWTKNIVIAACIAALLWSFFIAAAFNAYWKQGSHFLAILTVIFGLIPFYMNARFLASLIRDRKILWGKLVFGLICILIALLLGVPVQPST